MAYKDPIRQSEYSKQWKLNHPERYKATTKRFKEAHPELLKQYGRNHTLRLKKAAFNILGNKCNNPNCRWLNEDGTFGCTNFSCLQVDHVNGNGNKERRLGIGTNLVYKKIINGETLNYQLLCANCNWIKRVFKGPTVGGDKI